MRQFQIVTTNTDKPKRHNLTQEEAMQMLVGQYGRATGPDFHANLLAGTSRCASVGGGMIECPEIIGPMKIYRVSETEWYKANSLEEAIACAMVDTGLSQEELTEGITPAELTEAEMDSLEVRKAARFPVDEELVTFREGLRRENAAGETKPGLFCNAEA